MKEFQYTVKDACGIHARPAGLLVKVGGNCIDKTAVFLYNFNWP